MSFLRPEAKTTLLQWRDVILGLALVALGMWLGFGASGLVWIFAGAIVGIGAALAWTGWQRARIRRREGGRGVVELDERQLSFLDAGSGAVVALSDVTRIEIEITGTGTGSRTSSGTGISTSTDPGQDDMFWIFTRPGESAARIPASAVGSDKMIDALAGFPGANYENVIKASGTTDAGLFVIWQKTRPLLH
jgi:hypothetical protein